MTYGDQHLSTWATKQDPLLALHEQAHRSDPDLEETVLSDNDVFAMMKSGRHIANLLPTLHTSKSKDTMSSFNRKCPPCLDARPVMQCLHVFTNYSIFADRSCQRLTVIHHMLLSVQQYIRIAI
jgi:hypothetical protein